MKKRPLLLPAAFIFCLLLLCRYLPLPRQDQTERERQEWVGRVVAFSRTAGNEVYRIHDRRSNQEYLVSYPIQTFSKQSISKQTISKQNTSKQNTGEKRLTVDAKEPEQTYQLGWVLRIRGSLRPYEPPGNPGEFNARRYDVGEGISGRIKAQTTQIIERDTDHWAQGLLQLKQLIGRRLTAVLPKQQAGVLRAMLLADKEELDSDINQQFILSGTAHILAVSGLHVSLIGQGLLRLLKKCLPLRVAVCITAVVLLVYAAMVGDGYGIRRATIMSLLQLAAILLGRRYDPPTALASAAVITVLRRPYCLYSQSFLLSYGAVIAILALPKRVKWQSESTMLQTERVNPWTRLFAKLYPALWLYLYLLPLQQHLFANSSLWTAVLNLAVLPLGGTALLLTCLILPLLWLPLPLLQVVMQPLRLLLLLLLMTVKMGGRLPGRVVGRMDVKEMLVVFGLIIALRVWEGRRLKHYPGRSAFLPLAVAAMLLTVGFRWGGLIGTSLPASFVRYTMMDVGQGDCNLLQSGDQTVLMVDCGSSSKTDVGRRVVAAALFTQGISHIDALFLTHPDADHINGVEGLLEAGIEIGMIYVPPAFATDRDGADLLQRLKERDQSVRQLYDGDRLSVGAEDRKNRLTVTCIAAGREAKEDSNAMSLVLEVRFGDFSALLTGDLPGEEEEELFRTRAQQTYTVLKTAHHGSRFSTGEIFLERCRFQYAGLSCGSDNRYGHPAQTVLAALAEQGIEYFRTDRQGAISFLTDGRRIRVEVYGKEFQ
ncbi:MAG: DNA internalization-related competence protein ComEC/Rec2 [Eubacteriales bacterium]|nr:DNA internalization-related competence protein ComEC/Rec2 [Eubacteriales bacterium]